MKRLLLRSGKAKSTISERMNKAVWSKFFKTSEIHTPGGFQAVRLIPADLVYEWLLADNIELAKAMGKAGATVYLHQLAGYKISSNAIEVKPQLPQTYIEALKALVASEEAKEQLILQNSILENQVESLTEDVERQAEVIDELYDYSSIIRVAKFNQVNEKTFSWRKLKATSEVLGLDILQAPCPRYVTKNLYHREAWRVAYPEYLLPEATELVKIE